MRVGVCPTGGIESPSLCIAHHHRQLPSQHGPQLLGRLPRHLQGSAAGEVGKLGGDGGRQTRRDGVEHDAALAAVQATTWRGGLNKCNGVNNKSHMHSA